jgi:hypothetical protein
MRRTPGTPAEKLALLRGVDETSLPHLVADVLYFCRNHRNVVVTDGPGDGRRDVSSQTPDSAKHLAQCRFHVDVTAAVWSSQDSVDTLGQRFLSRFELFGAHTA